MSASVSSLVLLDGDATTSISSTGSNGVTPLASRFSALLDRLVLLENITWDSNPPFLFRLCLFEGLYFLDLEEVVVLCVFREDLAVADSDVAFPIG